MIQKSNQHYVVVCDSCGKKYTLSPETEHELGEALWLRIGDKHYCPGCYDHNTETPNTQPIEPYNNDDNSKD